MDCERWFIVYYIVWIFVQYWLVWLKAKQNTNSSKLRAEQILNRVDDMSL